MEPTKFKIYNGSKLIGWSELECGDPPMGMAFGTFHSNENYSEIQALFRAHYQLNPNVPKKVWQAIGALDLRAETESAELISDMVYFIDPTGEFEDEMPQVHVRCRTAEGYAKYFPEHLRAYETAFDGEDTA